VGRDVIQPRVPLPPRREIAAMQCEREIFQRGVGWREGGFGLEGGRPTPP
jgi:hypothetical protein